MFRIKLALPSDYPHAPPKGAPALSPGQHGRSFLSAEQILYAAGSPRCAGYFLTKIFHPNISKTGEICVNTLKKDWRHDLGIGHVLQVCRSSVFEREPSTLLASPAADAFAGPRRAHRWCAAC